MRPRSTSESSGATMTADFDVVLFAEDLAQERFLVALVVKVASELGLDENRMHFTVRNAAGGKGRAMSSYKNFIRDFALLRANTAIVIVALDSDCRPRHQVAQEVAEYAARAGYAGPVVAAVAVPHIEKWYVLDREAFRQATGGATLPNLPERCEPDYYKQAIVDVLKESGIAAPLGASSYAEEYVAALDIEAARQRESSFNAFYVDLRQCITSYEH